jgi:hypothetical protein
MCKRLTVIIQFLIYALSLVLKMRGFWTLYIYYYGQIWRILKSYNYQYVKVLGSHNFRFWLASLSLYQEDQIFFKLSELLNDTLIPNDLLYYLDVTSYPSYPPPSLLTPVTTKRDIQAQMIRR